VSSSPCLLASFSLGFHGHNKNIIPVSQSFLRLSNLVFEYCSTTPLTSITGNVNVDAAAAAAAATPWQRRSPAGAPHQAASNLHNNSVLTVNTNTENHMKDRLNVWLLYLESNKTAAGRTGDWRLPAQRQKCQNTVILQTLLPLELVMDPQQATSKLRKL
jgi:hypothetical protein